MSDDNGTTEEFEVSGDDLLDKVKNLIHEGNVRRIMVLDPEGRTIVEIPMTLGVVGALLAPWLAAIGGVAAVVSSCTVRVERRSDD